LRLSIEDADYHALAAFRRALREFSAFSESAARAAGLTPQQHQALLSIRGHGRPMSVGALAEELLIRPNSALELAGRLVKAGLINRTVAADDRRRVDLTLTDKAEALLSELSATHIAELRRRRPLLEDLLARLE
jgi:DNA-binding MarR family transcriptional regulator